MQGYNVLAVFNPDKSRLLMCKRRKNPYKGLSNLVGGKIEQDESGEAAAYRELFEETSISSADIKLTHLMDFTYYLSDVYVEVYVGKLNWDVAVRGDENELYWAELTCDFFDTSLFGGDGNIGHMLERINVHEDILFAK